MKRALFTALLFSLTAGAAAADPDTIPTEIITQVTTPPVVLTNCYAEFREGTTYLFFSTHSQNVSEKPVTAVEFVFYVYDSFGKMLMNRTGTDRLYHAPGGTLDDGKGWHAYNATGNAPALLKCGVLAVRFADGTLWNAPLATPAPKATPTPKA